MYDDGFRVLYVTGRCHMHEGVNKFDCTDAVEKLRTKWGIEESKEKSG
jgi:hypothetical protein